MSYRAYCAPKIPLNNVEGRVYSQICLRADVEQRSGQKERISPETNQQSASRLQYGGQVPQSSLSYR